MHKPRLQLSRRALNHDVLVDLHVAHRRILLPGTALKVSHASTKQGQFVESRTAMAQPPPEKMHVQPDVVAADSWIANRALNFCMEFRRDGLVRVQEQDPFVLKGKRMQRPLPFLGPATAIVELNHLRSERARNLN